MTTSRPDPEDLTARARIRDAALQHFGEEGFDGATIRSIAKTAGVSSGLVRHHFGSKQALRDACDEYLSKAIRQINEQVRADGTAGDMNYVAVARAAMGPYQKYLARALAEGAAAPLFDAMVQLGEQWLADADKSRTDTPDVDRRTRATVITAMALAIPVLHQHVTRGMGVDLFTPEGDLLLARTLVDIYSHPLLPPDQALQAKDTLDRLQGLSASVGYQPAANRTE